MSAAKELAFEASLGHGIAYVAALVYIFWFLYRLTR